MTQQIQALAPCDFHEVQSFYWTLIEQMQDAEFHPGWEKGVYPADAFLKESLAAGELYALRADGKIIAAMVLNHQCNDGYNGTKWNVEASVDEITVIHALGVLPQVHGQGVAPQMVEAAIQIAREKQQKAIRLDVLGGNIPALKLYEKFGFQYHRTVQMFYEDTGWTNFLLYELVL